jgi:serine/threonine-protein kinase RIM15
MNPVDRFRFNHVEGENIRRPNSMPSRLRTASISTSNSGEGSGSSDAPSGEIQTPPSSVASLDFKPESKPEARLDVKKPTPIDLRKKPDPHDRAVTCLLAEDNPITAKIIETLLIRLGCRCVVVADGSEAISVAMGDIKFDVILMDLHMPVLDGEGAARYIKNTNSKNTNTPIIAVSAYSGSEPPEANGLFAGALSKPVQKADLLAMMRQIGFKTSAMPNTGKGAPTTKVAVAVS